MAETPLTVLRRDLDRLAKRQRAGAAKVAADVDELRRELAAARDAMLRAAEGTGPEHARMEKERERDREEVDEDRSATSLKKRRRR